MSKQIPEGATHTSAGMFYRRQGKTWSLWGGEQKWIETACAPEWLAAAAEPIEGVPQWQGPEDGLPPVGTVCAVLNSALGSPKWERCTILYSGKRRIMYDSESCEERVAFIEDLKFRKARTPEQIKAEQREKAVANLAAVIRDSGWESPEILAAYLDSHGYGKFEIVDGQP